MKRSCRRYRQYVSDILKKEKRSRFDACKSSSVDVVVTRPGRSELVDTGNVAQHAVGGEGRHHSAVPAFGVVVWRNDRSFSNVLGSSEAIADIRPASGWRAARRQTRR